MTGKKRIAFGLAVIIGLNSSIYMLPNKVYATEISTEEKLGVETDKKEEENSIEKNENRQDLQDNIKVENTIAEKSTANGKEVSKWTKDVLQGVNYFNDKTIADLLAPNRFSAADKLNKQVEISKRDNIPIASVTEEQVLSELKAENVHVMSYGEAFLETQKNIESIIEKLVENSTIEKGYVGDLNEYFVNKITNNKEKLLLGISYIHRLYDFNIGNENIKDILTYTPSYYGKQVDPLDWLISIGGAGGEMLKASNNTKAYKNLFKGKITDKDSVLSFLEDNKNKFEPNTTMEEWFKKTSKAIIVEIPTQINPNAKTSLYSKLSSEAYLQEHILPLLTVSENSIYVISNFTTITYGLVDTYVDKSLKQNNNALYQEKIKEFKSQVEKAASQQNDFIELWQRIGKANAQNLLSTNRLVIDSLRMYNSGTVNASQEWSPKFGDKAATGVKEFITPLNLYANYFGADGQAEGGQVRLFLAKALEERGLSTYTHELTHLLIGTFFLNNNGVRDGLETEFYPRGLFETYGVNGPTLNLNLIYDHKEQERYHNASPERFKTEKDLQEYMRGVFDVIYTLDYAEANVILKKDKNDKQKWFHKLEQKNDTRNRFNQGDTNATHKIDSVKKISIDEANELNTINDLIERNIISSRYEVNGLKTTGDVASNGYYVIPLFSSNYASVENNNGVSGDIMMKRQAYELLAEYGYYDGVVPYISNQYKDEATKDGVILSDEYILEKIFQGQYETMTDFKKEMFKERINKKDQLKPISIQWEGRKVTLDNFEKINKLMTEAVESDLKNVQELPEGWNNVLAENTKVELLKKEIFKAYLNDTDDFKQSIYSEDESKPVVIPVTSVTLNKTKESLLKGNTTTLVATVNPSNATNKGVTWSSSNSSVAKVDQNGKVTAVGKGTATITVTTKDGAKKATCIITVTEESKPSIVPVQSVTLNKAKESLLKGNTITLVATINPSNATNKGVTWSSSNSSVAKVDQNGKVTAVGKGTATITVTTKDGAKKATCTIIVTEESKPVVIPVTSVALNKTKESLLESKTTTLTATINPSNATNKGVTWSSSNKSVATVDQSGKVTAVGKGTATITVTTKDGSKKATCTITVTELVTNTAIQGERIYGSDRYETSYKLFEKGWSNSDTVILAYGLDYPDALSASPLAGKKNAPILLVKNSGLKSQSRLKQLLINKSVKNAIIVGGTGVISSEIDKDLKAMGISVKRLGGKDRYETSVLIAKEVGINTGEVALVNGLSFADALSISSIATKKKMPILLTRTDVIPESIKKYLDSNSKSISKSYVIGSTGVVSNNVLNKLKSPVRLGGSDRFKTNKSVLDRFKGELNLSNIYIASGLDFPDALAASALAGKNNNFLLLSHTTRAEVAVKSEVSENKGKISKAYILGSKAVISDEIIRDLVVTSIK